MISNQEYYHIVHDKFFTETQVRQAVKNKTPPSTHNVFDINEDSVEQLNIEIRNYNMNICKQMKKKLCYLGRENFQVNGNRGSASGDQVYIDCSTPIYEYFRRYPVRILVDMLNCKEDVKKRRLRCKQSMTGDVEAQYSIQFKYNNIKHSVSIRLYYTRCSIWIQGLPTPIDGIMLAQLFPSCPLVIL